MRATHILLFALTPILHARDPDLGARVRPLPAANRFAEDGFFVWCGAPVKEGENGLADLLTTSTSLDLRHQAA